MVVGSILFSPVILMIVLMLPYLHYHMLSLDMRRQATINK